MGIMLSFWRRKSEKSKAAAAIIPPTDTRGTTNTAQPGARQRSMRINSTQLWNSSFASWLIRL